MNHDMQYVLEGLSPFFTENYLLAQLDIRMMFLHKRSYFELIVLKSVYKVQILVFVKLM